jgi:hypothetical protein
MSSSASLEDAKVCGELESLFSAPFPMQKFKLWFTYYGMPYFTTFYAEHTDKRLYVHNNCVKIVFVPENKSKSLHPYEGRIAANILTPPCFTPRLARQSSSAASISSVDVLQTLKTKIATLFPMIKTDQLCITDVAEKDGVDVSSFRILRGEDAVYEKYGYQSEFIEDLKHVVRGLRWGDELCVKELQVHINSMLAFVNNKKGSAILLTGTDIAPSTRLVDIMQSIEFEYEVAYAEEYTLCFSYHLLLIIGNKRIEILNATGRHPLPKDYMYASEIGKPNAWVFCFNPKSDAWRRSKDALLFSHVEKQPTSNSAASSRKTRRRRRH